MAFEPSPAQLFATALIPVGPSYLYDVTADGRRFVALSPRNESSLGDLQLG